MASPSPLHRLATQNFDERCKSKQSHFWTSKNTPFWSKDTELCEPNIYIWAFLFESSKQSFQVTKLNVFIYVLLYRHLPTEIVIFINVCYQMKCFSCDSFSFLGADFANIPPTFLTSFEVQRRYSKILKYSELCIRDHLSGTKVRIWTCSEHDAVFSFSCIAMCNLTKLFTFTSKSFLS